MVIFKQLVVQSECCFMGVEKLWEECERASVPGTTVENMVHVFKQWEHRMRDF